MLRKDIGNCSHESYTIGMRYSVKGTNMELTPEVSTYIEEKIGSLDRFIKHVDSAVQGWVEVGRIGKHHQTGKVWRAEVQIHLPGRSMRSEAVAKTIFLAINEVKDKLQRELKQYKRKQATKQKKGARSFKPPFPLRKPPRLKGKVQNVGIKPIRKKPRTHMPPEAPK